MGVYSAPAPQEDAPGAVPYIHEEIEALPYEHDATGDVAEAYVHEEVEALPYVHQEPEPAAALPVIPQPLLTYAVTNYAALPKAGEAGEAAEGAKFAKFALLTPFPLLAGYRAATGCV